MTTPVTISLPEHLAERAAEAAKAAGETIDAYIARALAGELEREQTDRFFAERRARGDVARALEILQRPSAEPPEPGDELPNGYRRTR